jgi:hypothetical protein
MGDPRAKVPNPLIAGEGLTLSSSVVSFMTSYLFILVHTLPFGRCPKPMPLGLFADEATHNNGHRFTLSACKAAQGLLVAVQHIQGQSLGVMYHSLPPQTKSGILNGVQDTTFSRR